MNIKRHFYNHREYVLDLENQVIKLMYNFHKKLLNKQLWGKFGFKKMAASLFGDVLETDKFKSPFKVFARISWIDMPVLDKKYINAGIIIEPKVLDLIAAQKNIISVQGFDPKKYNYDYFAGKDEIISGIPDGLAQPGNIVIEVKTSGVKKIENWIKFGVPEGYLKQAQLYTYLMGFNVYAIVATFLEEEDYIYPDIYPIQNRRTKTWSFKINKSQVKDDIKIVKDWYKKHIQTGISPKFDFIRDKNLIDYLMCKNEREWIKLQKQWLLEGKINLETL